MHKAYHNVKKYRKSLELKRLCIYGDGNPSDGSHKACRSHREENSRRSRIYHKEIKLDVLDAYGNRSCSCCSENRVEVLHLDHIFNDGGGADRKLKGPALYKHLKRNGFPDKDRYQILCSNCNHYKYFFPDKFCYHQIRD